MNYAMGRLVAMACGVVLAASFSTAHATLTIVNAGFEGPGDTPWVLDPVANVKIDSSDAHSGLSSLLFQKIASIDNSLVLGTATNSFVEVVGDDTYSLEFWLKGVKPSSFGVSIDAIDLAVLAGTTDSNGWTPYSIAGLLLSDDTHELLFSVEGNSFDLRVDDIAFTLDVVCTVNCPTVPEPGTLLLVGAAMIAGGAVRRRRMQA